MAERARKPVFYCPGEVPPELGGDAPGGATPPLFGSGPPVDPPPPELGVPVAGGVDDAGGTVPPAEGAGAGVALGVPPPEPPIGVPLSDPSFAFLFFFSSPGCTGSPVVTGGTTGTV